MRERQKLREGDSQTDEQTDRQTEKGREIESDQQRNTVLHTSNKGKDNTECLTLVLNCKGKSLEKEKMKNI